MRARAIRVVPWERIILPAGLICFSFCAAWFHVSCVDPGFHIRTGLEILATGRIPSVNTFSHTMPGHPWLLMQAWPAVLFAWIEQRAGLEVLIGFKAMMAAGCALGIYAMGVHAANGRRGLAATVATVAVLLMRPRMLIRPYMFSTLLLVLLVAGDRRWGNRRAWQWGVVPLLMAVWANLHIGLVYGLVYLAVCAAAEWLDTWTGGGASRARPARHWGWRSEHWTRPVGGVLALLAALGSLAVFNPNGVRVITLPFHFFADRFWQDVIVEFQSPSPEGSPLFYASMVLLLVLQWRTRARLDLQGLLTTTVFALLALQSQRSIDLYAVVAAPWAAMMLESLCCRTAPGVHDGAAGRGLRFPAWLHSIFLCILLPVCWAALVRFGFQADRTLLFGPGLFPRFYPTALYAFVKEAVPPQPLFNDMRFGGGILWWLYPRFRPFIDSRGDAYPVSFWTDEYFPVLEGRPEAGEILSRYRVGAVLLPVSEGGVVPGLCRVLERSHEWGLAAFSDYAVLYLRRDPLNAPLLERHEFEVLDPVDVGLASITGATAVTAELEALRALRVDPSCRYAWTALMRARMHAGDHAGALRAVRRLRGLGVGGAALARDEAYLLFTGGQWNVLRGRLPALAERAETAGYAAYLAHHMARAAGDWTTARALLAAALEHEPENREYRAAMKTLEAGMRSDHE